jgi:hypothetical protein
MRALAAGLLAAVVLPGCGGPSHAQVVSTQVRGGIGLQMKLGATHDGLSVDARIENLREEPLVLRQDGCGRVSVAEVERTTHRPRGRTWTGSVQALKRIVLRGQASTEAPETLAPAQRKCAGDGEDRTLTLKPGAVRHERWVTAIRPSVLDFVGSKHAVARLQVFEPEAKKPAVQLERPVSSVASWKASYQEGPSNGQRFDALLADARLRRTLGAQPAASWRDASLTVVSGKVRLKAISARYERAFLVTGDGKRLHFEAPGRADRTLPYPTAAAELPHGIRVIPEKEGYVATQDVLPGALELPSGRLAVDAYVGPQTPIVDERARPGSHPFRITLARPVEGGQSGERVALATLSVSDRPTVSWRYVLTVGVDGGSAAFTSAEGAGLRAGLSPDDWQAADEADADAMFAHRYVAERVLSDDTNLMLFETGLGDGGYNLYVGLDADGHPTRYVLDCGLLHLDWPKGKKG